MVELGGGRTLVELERSLDVAKVVVLVLEEARDHLGEMLLILLRARLVRSAAVAFLLNDAGRVIEWAARHEALLPGSTLDIQVEHIGWELLATLDSEDVARLYIGPGDLQESLDLPGDHQIVYGLEVDLVRHFALPQLQREVSHAHQHEVDRQRNDRERNSDLIVLLRVQDQEKEDGRQDVLEVQRGID